MQEGHFEHFGFFGQIGLGALRGIYLAAARGGGFICAVYLAATELTPNSVDSLQLYFCFGLFLWFGFISLWGLTFVYFCFGLSFYVCFGLSLWFGFISLWGLTFVDFGYNLLWSVSVFPRRRMDFSLRHRDDALFRDTVYPFTV